MHEEAVGYNPVTASYLYAWQELEASDSFPQVAASGLLLDVVGYAGAALLLGRYVLVSSQGWKGDPIAHQLLKPAGRALSIATSAHQGAYLSAEVNVVWIGIAALAVDCIVSRV